MAVKILVATLKDVSDSEVVLDLNDADGAEVGQLSIDREVWDEFDDDTDTLVIDGVADIDVTDV